MASEEKFQRFWEGLFFLLIDLAKSVLAGVALCWWEGVPVGSPHGKFIMLAAVGVFTLFWIVTFFWRLFGGK